MQSALTFRDQPPAINFDTPADHDTLQACKELWEDFRNPELFLPNALQIQTRQGTMTPFVLKKAQRRLIERVQARRLAGRPVRFIIDKTRRVGLSSVIAGLIFQETPFFEGQSALILAHEKKAARNLFSYYDRFEHSYTKYKGVALPRVIGRSASQDAGSIRWANRSQIEIATAKSLDFSRSFDFRFLHLCLATGTPVLGSNGRIIPVEDLKIGERVVTHSGAATTVTAVTGRANLKPTVIVHPWLGYPVELTDNHPVWTRRGWVPAGELSLSDEVAMPIRAITHTRTQSERLSAGKKDRLGRERRARGSGLRLKFDRETGFAFGYYLAEGCAVFQRGSNRGQPCKIVFGRDVDEKPYADRAYAALADVVTSRRIRRHKNSRTVEDALYGSPLARFIVEHFGAKDDKHIPDWVFEAGREFCQGLLLGYLSGDGSKKYSQRKDNGDSPDIRATSIRASLVTQARDLAAALGYGWAAVEFKPAGFRAGRNEQAAWTVRWGGDAARKLRAGLGLGQGKESKRPWVQKYTCEKETVWLKLRSLKSGSAKQVWDVEVEHADHSFRTLHFALKNSEYAYYPSIRGLMTALIATVADDPATMVFKESTAKGYNEFYTDCIDAMEGRGDYEFFFVGCFEDEENCRSLERDDIDPEKFMASLSDEEFALMERYHLQPEQLYWRRKKLEDFKGDLKRFDQEYPHSWEVSFQASGRQRFDPVLFVGMPTEVPYEQGELRKEEINRKEQYVFRSHQFGELTIWKRFKPGGDYIGGVDVAKGVDINDGVGTPDPDWCVAVIGERSLGEQVMELHTRVEAFPLAQYLYDLGHWCFQESRNWIFWVIEVEFSGGNGLAVCRELLRLGYPQDRIYFSEVLDEANQRRKKEVGFVIRPNTRPSLISNHERYLIQRGLILHSKSAIAEHKTFVKKKTGKIEHEDGCHDDRVFGCMYLSWGFEYAPVSKPIQMPGRMQIRKYGVAQKPQQPLRDLEEEQWWKNQMRRR